MAQFSHYLIINLLGLALNDTVVVLLELLLHVVFGPVAWTYLLAKLVATAMTAV